MCGVRSGIVDQRVLRLVDHGGVDAVLLLAVERVEVDGVVDGLVVTVELKVSTTRRFQNWGTELSAMANATAKSRSAMNDFVLIKLRNIPY